MQIVKLGMNTLKRGEQSGHKQNITHPMTLQNVVQ